MILSEKERQTDIKAVTVKFDEILPRDLDDISKINTNWWQCIIVTYMEIQGNFSYLSGFW